LVNATESINAVSGKLHFSSDTLSIASISTSGSIMTLWAQEPTYSNTNGSATFDGVDVNGFSRNGGTIVTITFRAKKEGAATLSLAGSSVLANDGNGTDVTKSVGTASFTILPAVQKESPEPTPTEPSTEAPLPIEIFVYVTPPAVTDYSQTLVTGNFIVVKGTATPNTSVAVTLTNDTTGVATNSLVQADDSGVFTYVSDEKPASGSYTITLSELIQGIHGPLAEPLHIRVFTSSLALWFSTLLGITIPLYWAFGVFVVLIILLLLSRKRSKKPIQMPPIKVE
jgi:hypothetical protein